MINDDDLLLVDPNLLTPLMRKLANAIGLPDTLKLLQARGGTSFRFPINAEGSLLADIVGLESAQKLAALYGEQKWDLPKADQITIKLRNLAIIKARETKSASQVALMFGLTRRHVINLTNDIEEAPRNLFN